MRGFEGKIASINRIYTRADNIGCGTLHDQDRGQHHHHAHRLQRPDYLAQRNRSDNHRENRFKATGDDRFGWLKVLQASKVKCERYQDRQHGKRKQEAPRPRRIMGSCDSLRRIHANLEQRCGQGRIKQDHPAIIAGKQVMAANVVISERECGNQGGRNTHLIEM